MPRIWEVEGSRRSEITNASKNDYWVRAARQRGVLPLGPEPGAATLRAVAAARRGARCGWERLDRAARGAVLVLL